MNEVITKEETAIVQQPEQPAAHPLLSLIEKTNDIEKLERLFALYEKDQAKQDMARFNEAMAKSQYEMDSIVRNKFNQHNRSSYADLDAIHAAIQPTYTKHGLSLTFAPHEAKTAGFLGVTATLSCGAYSKEFKGEFAVDGAGLKGGANKTPIQAQGSTYSYARRYMEMMIFNLSLSDDTDGAPQRNRPEPEPQPEADLPKIESGDVVYLDKLLKKHGVEKEEFFARAGISALKQLPKEKFAGAQQWIIKQSKVEEAE